MKKLRPLAANHSRRRRGFTTPAVAIALLVVMGALALMLDRLWLDAADLELTTAAEAAALSAAGELATDDLLKATPDPELRQELARTAAAFIAGQNIVAGQPVVLDTSLQGDIQFGQLVLDSSTGLVRFDQSTTTPTTVVISTMRTRRTNNPVGLFVAGLTQLPYGDVVSRVEATVDNRVSGVRPLDGAPVPALPMAIWWQDPAGLRTDTWSAQIESGRGADNYGYDSIGHQVLSGPDGIPEIVLHSQANGQQMTDANLMVLDIGTGLNDAELGRQFASGWTVDDLITFGGEFQLPLGSLQTLQASAELRNNDRQSLDTLVGEPRICLLYSAVTPSGTSQTGLATCIRMVAIRILSVTDVGNGSCQLVAQPCVIKTRTAIVEDMSPYYTVPSSGTTAPDDPNTTNLPANTATAPPNPYIYKLRLTH